MGRPDRALSDVQKLPRRAGVRSVIPQVSGKPFPLPQTLSSR